MKLLTKELAKKLPPLYGQENVPEDEKVVYAKFFTPMSNWTWYATEYDPEERIFYGLVFGHEKKWGYFSLDELQELADKHIVERDLYFDQCKIKELPENRPQKHLLKVCGTCKFGIEGEQPGSDCPVMNLVYPAEWNEAWGNTETCPYHSARIERSN